MYSSASLESLNDNPGIASRRRRRSMAALRASVISQVIGEKPLTRYCPALAQILQ